MNQWWDTVNQRYQGITHREKVLILLSGLVVIGMLGYTLLLETSLDNWQAGIKAEQSLTKQIAELEEQERQLKQKLSVDPNLALRQQIKRQRADLLQIDEQLRQKSVDLISAQQMASTLREILATSRHITLLGLESVPPVGVLLVDDKASAIDGKLVDSINLYQHGVKMKIQGKYFDILNFFKKVESLPTRLFWKNFDYQVGEYPQAEVEFDIYTLSTGKDFIRV